MASRSYKGQGQTRLPGVRRRSCRQEHQEGPKVSKKNKGEELDEWRRAACTCNLTCARTDGQQVGRFSGSQSKENEMRVSGPPSKSQKS